MTFSHDEMTCVSDASWVTFDDQAVPSFQTDEQEETEPERDAEEKADEKSNGAERAEAEAGESLTEQQKSRDEIAMEQALAKYSAQLEQRQ